MLAPVVGLLVPRTSTPKSGLIAGIVLLPLAVGVLALVAGTIKPSLRGQATSSQAMDRNPAGNPGLRAPQGVDPSTARPVN